MSALPVNGSAGLRIAMAQINLLVGDVSGNAQKIVDTALRARDELGADAVVFPELALTGYPPEDLLLRPGLHLHVLEAIERIKRTIRGITMIIGHPQQALGGLYNAVSVIRDGELLARGFKQHLPNYSVFDEKRYFVPGTDPCVVDIGSIPVGVTICEDIWTPGPAQQARDAGARYLININASPFHTGKGVEREEVLLIELQEKLAAKREATYAAEMERRAAEKERKVRGRGRAVTTLEPALPSKVKQYLQRVFHWW